MDDPRYHTKRWQKLRAEVIKRDGRYCARPDCQADMSVYGVTQVNHKHAVRDGGDFWDPANLEVLCKDHHRIATLEQEAARLARKAKVSLEPVSPNG